MITLFCADEKCSLWLYADKQYIQLKERSNFFSFLKQIQHNKFIIFQIHFTQFFAFKFHAKQTKFLVNSKNKFRLKTIYVKCCFAKFLNSQFGFTFVGNIGKHTVALEPRREETCRHRRFLCSLPDVSDVLLQGMLALRWQRMH